MIQQKKAQADKLLKVLTVALIFSVMNGTMFNVALPILGEEFDLLPSESSWVLSSYMVVYAIGSVVYGKLADRYKLKDLITFGLLFFAAGSLIGMLAQQYWIVILGRVLQASGAAVMPAIAMIIPIRYFPAERRGRALGTTAIGLALGSALGPIFAGMISSLGSWRLLFLFSFVSLVTLPFFRKYLDDEKGKAGTMDFLGGGLLAGTISLMLLAITQSAPLLALGGMILLVLFVYRIRTAAEPFINPSLFSNSQYSLLLGLAFIATSLNFALTFMTPQFLARLNDLPPNQIGFVLFPAALLSALLGRIGGKLADERGNGILMLVSSSLLITCFVVLSSIVGADPYWIAIILLTGNVGLTFMQITMSNTISRTLAKDQIGVGMGLFSMINFISGAIAMSVVGKLLDQSGTLTAWNPFVSDVHASMYSNIFIAMTLLIILVLVVYQWRFGKQPVSQVRSEARS